MANNELLNTVDQLFQESLELFQEQQRPKVYATEDMQLALEKQYMYEDLADTLIKAIKDKKEVEIRFGWITENRFIPGVSKEYFFNLLQVFQKQFPDVKSNTTTTYLSDKGVRITVNSSGKVTADKKTTESHFDDDFWGFRISIAKEEKVSDVPKDYTSFPYRNKTRWSFILPGRQMDLTIVTMGTEVPIYEVEIEYLKSKNLDIYKDVETALSHMQKTHVDEIIPQHNVKIIMYNYNSKFVSNEQAKRLHIFDRTENKPESFKWQNLFFGGQYYLTPKLDGVRRRIYFDTNGIFEIGPGSTFIRQIGNARAAKIPNTIIDAEYYPSLKGAPQYYPFDCLYYNNASLLNSPFSARLSYLDQISLPSFRSKPFYGDGNFYKNLQDAKDWADKNSDIRFDGFIAQSNEPIYKGQKTMKLKPMEELTIDLLSRVDDMKQVRLYSRGPQGLIEENFSHPEELPSLKSDEGRYTIKNLKIPADAGASFIAEYRFKNKQPWLRFKGLRPDKIEPNFHKVVKDNYFDYFIDPTTLKDLTDGSLLPWKKWASSQKRKLIRDYVMPNSTVLDIGIGRGGTVAEVAEKASKVYGIDPSKQNLSALIERFGDNKRTLEKIQLARIKGQDTQKVVELIGSPVNTILSMFSISFFYESEATLNAFCNTCQQCLAKDGKLIIMFMDGDRVREKLEKGKIQNNLVSIVADKGANYDKNQIGVPITIDLLQERDPIFRNQKEWLAPFDVLVSKLKSRGIVLSFDKYLDVGEEGMFFNSSAPLPALNLEFAKLNRMAVFENTSSIRTGGKVERNEDFVITNVKLGQTSTIDDKWTQFGIEWDDKSFIRSYLFLTAPDDYKKDPDEAIISCSRDLVQTCTSKNFTALEDGRVLKRLAFDALYRTKSIDTKEKALKQARKDYLARCANATVGHEASGFLTIINPNRKIIIIDQNGTELKRYGKGVKTCYILKVGNYAYSPLKKVEGYVHTEPTRSSTTGVTDDTLKKWKDAIRKGDNVQIDEMILDVDASMDNDFAIKYAVDHKNYDVVQVLVGFVDLDKKVQIQNPKGKIIERTLRQDLIRLAGGDKKLLSILGNGGSEKVKSDEKVLRDSVASDEDFLDELVN